MIKLFLYVSIAMLTAFLTSLQHYSQPPVVAIKSFDQLTSIQIAYLCINIFLQGLIAGRAFIDESSTSKSSASSESAEAAKNLTNKP